MYYRCVSGKTTTTLSEIIKQTLVKEHVSLRKQAENVLNAKKYLKKKKKKKEKRLKG